MPKQEVNIPLLRKYVEWVEEQAALPLIDRNWMQIHWITPPASRATWLLGLGENTSLKQLQRVTKMRQTVAQHCGTAYCVAGKIAADHDERYRNEEVVEGVSVATTAAKLLGVPEHVLRSQGGLFDGSNTAADIRRIAEELAGEEL